MWPSLLNKAFNQITVLVFLASLLLAPALKAATPREIYDFKGERPEHLWTCYMSLKRSPFGLTNPFQRPAEWASYTAWSGMNKWVKQAKRAGLTPQSCLKLADNFDVKKAAAKKQNKKPSKLNSSFTRLDQTSRRSIQEALSKDGFYTSTIDGLYGRGTEVALRAYNKQYLNNADLNVKANVDALYADLLKPQPETADTSTNVTELATTEVLAEENQTVVLEAATAVKEEPEAEVTTTAMLAAFESKQYTEANAMAQELAADGDATAQYYLGRMFAEGLGTLQISKSAHMWFNIASLNGSAEAVTARNSVADNMSQTAVEEAQEMALLCIQSKYSDCGLTIKPKAPTKAVQTVSTITDGSTVRNDFKAQTALRRKQLQYALKKLGVYSSTVDGLWGNNTSNAFTNYIKINSEEAANAEALFVSVLSKVDVPTRFAAPAKPKAKAAPKPAPKTYSAPSGWTTFSGTPQMSYEQAEAVCKPIAENAWDNTPGVQYDTTYNCNTWGSSSISCSSSSGPSSAAEGIAARLASAFAKSDASKRAFRSCMAQYGWKKN